MCKATNRVSLFIKAFTKGHELMCTDNYNGKKKILMLKFMINKFFVFERIRSIRRNLFVVT